MDAMSNAEAFISGNPELKKQHFHIGHSLFPKGYVRIDACTELVHIELDLTYTVLHVPSQEGLEYEDSSGTTFNFYLDGGIDERNTMKIPFNIGTSVFFDGFLLPHRQERNSISTPLLNVCACGNLVPEMQEEEVEVQKEE